MANVFTWYSREGRCGCQSALLNRANLLPEPETTLRFGGHLMVVISVQSFAQTMPMKHSSRTSIAPLHARSSLTRR